MRATMEPSFYDGIAARYDETWGPRFEAAAQQLLSRLGGIRVQRALDIGTGTGAVLRVLGREATAPVRLVGCDRSLPMLARARGAAAGVEVVAADAVGLPFRDDCFDLVTANFVLSHLPDYREALREAFRVLRPAALLRVSNWAPATDPCSTAWRELLGAAVGAELVEKATKQVAPWESHFGDQDNLCAALKEAGFLGVQAASVPFDWPSSVEGYLADRELSAATRQARQALGEAAWRDFLKGARRELRARFGRKVSHNRGMIIATGVKR
jgi:ubiquinone/menaquinone biosynthesis C-methylase UbiE